MSHDDRTPQTVSIWDIHAAELRRHHERINEILAAQIDAHGRDGAGGRLGQVTRHADTLERRLNKDVEPRLRKVELSVAKGYVIAGGVAAAASALAAVAIRLLVG